MAKAGELKMPYLYGEARDALETVMQWEKYSEAPEMESQWKQPWMYESYPKMEAEFSGPQTPSYPQPPGGTPFVDCEPKGDAVGGGSVDPCQSGINCGQWVFTCAHRITNFNVPQSFGWIQSIKYGPNDTVTVTVCWDEAARAAGAKLGIHAIGPNGYDYVSYVDLQNCCPDKAICPKVCGGCAAVSMAHSTHQMSINETQTLTASGGGGKYTWSFSGGGTLSKTKGPTTVYTAPASNTNCLLNPTITLKDCCGKSTHIDIAVSAVAGGIAYKTLYDTYGDGCVHAINQAALGCKGELDSTIGCDSCDYGTACENCCQFVAGIGCPQQGFCCTQAALIARCSGCATCAIGTYDLRTEEQKTLGCCPAALL